MSPLLQRLFSQELSLDLQTRASSETSLASSAYSEANEDRQDIVKPHRKFTDEHAWKYQTEEQLGGSKYDGKVFHLSNCPTAPLQCIALSCCYIESYHPLLFSYCISKIGL